MEASSPLATMHRPVPVLSWGSQELFSARSHGHYSSNPVSISSGNMSLREQMHKGSADYFNVKDVRGSSPAASLAADLSQNFRIDSEARLVSLLPTPS
jgi:M-phase inducer tyrosine phosphatase